MGSWRQLAVQRRRRSLGIERCAADQCFTAAVESDAEVVVADKGDDTGIVFGMLDPTTKLDVSRVHEASLVAVRPKV